MEPGCSSKRTMVSNLGNMIEGDDPLAVTLAHQACVDTDLVTRVTLQPVVADQLGGIRREHLDADIREGELSLRARRTANAMLAIGITATPFFIRLTRGQVLSIKGEDYVEAARAVGNPKWRVAVRHVLPNILPQLMVQATLTIATAIIAEASMSFLGLGLQPPAPSWGSMLNSAQRFLNNAPWMALWPGVAIFATVLSFNLLGDGLRDALDPRSR